MTTNLGQSTATSWSTAASISYDLPKITLSQPPERSWSIDPARAVLLVHDMQYYFLRRFEPDTQPVKSLRTNVIRLVDTAREAGVQVAYTAQPGSMSIADRGLLADFWGPGMAMTAGDSGIIDPIGPRLEDWTLTKWRYSAFVRTDLHERMLAHRRDQLLICGVYGHVGVLTTALDAYSRDFETFLIGDAIADFTAAEHRLTLDLAAEVCAAVTQTDAAVRGIAETKELKA